MPRDFLENIDDSDDILKNGIVKSVDMDVEVITPSYIDPNDENDISITVKLDSYTNVSKTMARMQHAIQRLMDMNHMSFEDKIAFLSDELIPYNIINTITEKRSSNNSTVRILTYSKTNEKISNKKENNSNV